MSHPAAAAKQPALGLEATAAQSMEWRVRGDPVALWGALRAIELPPGVVVGIGAPLAAAVDADVPGLVAFERLQRGRFTLPATQHDLWTLALGATPGEAFERADRVHAALAPYAQLVEATSCFRYRDGRDLTGYRDGTENPKDDDAWDAALVADGEWAGSSFVLVQRYLHFRARFAALPQDRRDDTIGRTQDADEEIDEASETSHVKRTAQEDYDPPAFMLRRSLPWGTLRRHGLLFIAYVASLDAVQRQLERLIGLDDGRQDALLEHTQAETGAYYWCPPAEPGGRLRSIPVPRSGSLPLGGGPQERRGLRLPAVTAAVEAEPRLPPPAPPRVRLTTNGPLEAAGAFVIAGAPATQARLCRCGASATKPYCDNSHLRIGFAAPGEVPPLDEPQAEVTPTRTRVQPAADGPLLLWGAVEVCSESGRTITRCTNPTLCRCGASANKPFCDGSHAKIGFVAAP